MNIPKILHQTWKSQQVPAPFDRFMDTWKVHHPFWLHILWTDEMNRAFIASHFPEFLATYDGYDADIQRADAARYFILYYYGGVYADMDFECFRNIEPLLQDETCVVGREHDEHCKIHKKKIIISNAFIACTPRHNFITALCKEIADNRKKAYSRNTRILESTGPFMLTRLLEGFYEKNMVKVLPQDILYPLTKFEIKDVLSNDETSPAIREKLKNAFALHYYWGTWWKKGKKDRSLSFLGIKVRI